MSALTLGGYAVTWDTPAFVDGLVETVAPGAVKVEGPANVVLLAGDHEVEGRPTYARTKDDSLTFWVDQTGLAFRARLDPDRALHRGLARAVANGMDQCSVLYTAMHRVDGRISWARIGHIAILSDPAYESTSAWVVESPIMSRTPHQRAMSALWGKGIRDRLRHQVPAGASAVARSSALAISSEAGAVAFGTARPSPSPSERPVVPASVRALLAELGM
jgi:phage head maturation protease